MIDTNVSGTRYLQSFRRHVLGPVTTALDIVEAEQSEVAAEADAFEAFASRVADVDAAEPQWLPMAQSQTLQTRQDRCSQLERVREAYRETVMSVPHYEAVYDESLVENVMLELGEALAERFRPNGGQFTAPYKQALVTAAKDAATERERFLETLDREESSLETARDSLMELVVGLDGITIPHWYESTFAETLEGVVETRQRHLDRQVALPGENRVSLCTLLYDDQQWTFPVLTAAARTREILGEDESP
ncbi:DUF7260 family protein [Haloarcula marina]|uniref:DUF7260 family protein n=1 Tax=Haloarcula marina TaxID=2961574 RepID=UPI0020B7DDC3|nr:hypothetical protein [Halomicroarcula marina]